MVLLSVDPYTGAYSRKPNGNGHSKSRLRDHRNDRPPIAARIDLRRQVAPDVQAGYDLAGVNATTANHWTRADDFDADSSNSRAVRRAMVRKSREETRNNGFLEGMQKTHAAYIVRKGPRLRLLDADEREAAGNDEETKRIKRDWHKWCKVVKLRRKLNCMARTKIRDGEALAVCRNNPNLKHDVKLDFVLIETEQCQTPMLQQGVVGYVDGTRYDPYGNPLYYDILPRHPGSLSIIPSLVPDRIPARYVLHWFQLERPNQHRGVPEQRSTLGLGAVARRWREANVAGAEKIARISALIHTELAPFPDPTDPTQSEIPSDQRLADPLNPFDTAELPDGNVVVTMPMGWNVTQPHAEQPPATYEMFNKATNAELARPLGQPCTIAMADSSGVSFAGSKIECIPYYMVIDDVDREDCNDEVMDKLFCLWWQEYILFRLGSEDPIEGADPDEPPEHRWDWPRNPIADEQAEANTNSIMLRSGQITPSQVAHRNGESFEAICLQFASDLDIEVKEVKELLKQSIFAPKSGGVIPGTGGSANQKPGAGYGAQPGAGGEEPAPRQSDFTKMAAMMESLTETIKASQVDQRELAALVADVVAIKARLDEQATIGKGVA